MTGGATAWGVWRHAVGRLRPAFSRRASYLWFLVATAAFAIRPDLRGVTSLVRAIGLDPRRGYAALLRMFHSKAVDAREITRLWSKTAVELLGERIVRARGMAVLATDGVKVAKSGRKMPAVKTIHQESDSNTKPEFITGHSCLSVSLLATSRGQVAAVPLGTAIAEGVKLHNRDCRTFYERTLEFRDGIDVGPCIMLADAYYGCQKMAKGLRERGDHLLTRVKSNAVAHLPPETPAAPKRRGRPRKYGDKVVLRETFKEADGWTEARVELYGEEVGVRFKAKDLLWRPAGEIVRFVFVVLDGARTCMFLSTDTRLEPLEIVRLYSLRFRIEVGFGVAKHVTGSVLYHFWMRAMDRLGRNPKTQNLHHKDAHYRDGVMRKLRAYHCYMQAGTVAQGLLTVIGLLVPSYCWANHAFWMRTMNVERIPSEWVVQGVLRDTFPELLADAAHMPDWVKFIRERMDLKRFRGAA